MGQKGISVLEVILALAIFSLIASAMVSLALGGLTSLARGGEQTQAAAIAQEGIEAVRAIRDRAWNELVFSQSAVSSSTSRWEFSGEGTTEVLGKYLRTISVSDVCRSVADEIAACPGSYTDLHTKRVTVQVSWAVRPGVLTSIQRESYITNWDSAEWTQTDWGGGSGQAVWSDTTRYDSDDGGINESTTGELTLASGAGADPVCDGNTWDFDTAGNYTYDPATIEFVSSNAQLIAPPPAAHWWDSAYGYRQQLTVTTGANPPDGRYVGYTVNFTDFDTAGLVAASKMQPDCDDLRVLYWDGGGHTELDRDVLSCDATDTEVRFAIDTDIADSSSDVEYYIYYGNTGASAPPADQSNVYLWFDSGAVDRYGDYVDGRGDAWEGTRGQNRFGWNAAGYYDYDTQNNRTNSLRVPFVDLSERDALIEAEFYHTGAYSSDMQSGLIGRYIASSGYGGSNESSGHYYASLRAWSTFKDNQYSRDGNIVKASVSTAAVDGPLPGAATAGNQWRKQALAVWDINPTNAKFWDEDVAVDMGELGYPSTTPITSGTDANDYETDGEWGLIVNQDKADIRNILIRRYTEPEPTVSSGGEVRYPAYATDRPTVNPNTSYKPTSVSSWDSFAEVATKNGGEIYYQLSPDDGNIWYYWDGGAWSVASASDYNTASVVNTNIGSFSAASRNLMFRAFLESDGTQQVMLDSVDVECSPASSGTFTWDFIAPSNYNYDPTAITVATTSANIASSSFSTDQPIYPTRSYQPQSVGLWKDFVVASTTVDGNIYYQLSDDDGVTWYYYSGGSWNPVVTPTDYNTEAEVSANISSFSTSTGLIMPRAVFSAQAAVASALQMEVGQVTTDENWVTVNLQNTYVSPIVVAGFEELNNTLPASVRIDNLTSTSFDIRLQHPANFDINADEITYMVIEEGTWDLNGVTVEAHKYDTNTVGSSYNGWPYDTVTFDNVYPSDPIVLHQVMSNNDSSWISTWVSRNNSRTNPPNNNGARMGLNGAQVTTTHGSETIGWVAIERNVTGTINGVDFETYRTGDSIRGHGTCQNYNFQNSYGGTPLTMGFQQEMDGADGGWQVICTESPTQVGFHSEEDQVGDSERNHTTETGAYITFDSAFDYAEAAPPLAGSIDAMLDSITITSGVFQMEVGQVTTDENWVQVDLQNVYASPVVIAAYQEVNNTLPASVRLRNVGEDSFEIRLQHPSGVNLSADPINYMVIEEGDWEIAGTLIEAHKFDSDKVSSRSGGWGNDDTLSYMHSFSSDPIVLHQVMTYNDPAWITTWVHRVGSNTNPPNTTGVDIGLNAASVTTTHGSETIGWVAIERGITSTLNNIDFETYRTTDSVLGHDNGCYNFNYQNTYASAPLVFGFHQEMDGIDGGWSVTCNNTASQVGFHSEEDQEADSERAHTSETFAFIAFEGAFDYVLGTGSGYVGSGQLISSAYDTGSPSSFQIIDWDEVTPACTPLCTVQIELRTAPDAGGSPGVWSSWYGAGGVGTYFATSTGVLIPSALNGGQWIQYRANLAGDMVETPILQEVRINYK